MNFSEVFVRRPVMTVLLNVAIVAAGVPGRGLNLKLKAPRQTSSARFANPENVKLLRSASAKMQRSIVWSRYLIASAL
mgnify:CR=1 FL=1